MNERLRALRRSIVRCGLWGFAGVSGLVLLAVGSLFLAARLAGPLDIPLARPAVFYDSRGTTIGKWQENNQRWIPIRDMTPSIKLATLAIEDRRFFQHHGFDLRRIAGSALVDLRSLSKAQGASTITMQYAKNLFLTNNKTWLRKVEEMFLTMRLEMNESKKSILEGYLNTIYYGRGAYGIEAASKTYFNKTASELTLAQASMLAGIPNGPSIYSPLLHYNYAKKRQKLVLQTMAKCGYITKHEASIAAKAPLDLAKQQQKSRDLAPYFQAAVRHELLNNLDLTRKQLDSGGLKVYTTLDAESQRAAEYWVNHAIPRSSKIQTALVALDPKTGGVVAMIGGRNFQQSAFNRAIAAKRAPGSSFKPFLYYAALRNGFTPATRLKSAPTVFAFDDGRNRYQPNNFGGYYADAPITMEQALALSDNIFAVKTHLAIGMNQLVEAAKAAGITSPLEPIPSLALGSKPVSVLELARGYATLANMGARIRPNLITKVTDSDGHVLYRWHPVRKQVLNKQATFVVSQMMTGIFDKRLDGYTKVTGTPIADRLTHKMAAKTGSTSTDSWMAGFTPDLVTTVWVGYDKGETISTYPDTGYAKEIWSDFMESALEGKPKNDFKAPKGVVQVKIDPETGLLADRSSPGRPTYFIKGTAPTHYSNGETKQSTTKHEAPGGVKSFIDHLFHWWR
ncbi:transglycosylase domain-containing protein [Sporolactobacillus spathodeae]|uniref:1A family penicillin-binding protein n=1 Tax=Sporolactobacillus spathodeae TaxID=1465502 RepID=A0ABS2QD11_9BACL|nr:PBP1A family penicillin-binding protein [Sporolactobacillus spathodeae]MBM7659034.1 1A family penicillin-binding protein [Sporolactobacillus spathodeae]